jgi:hypothetical protein
MRVPAFKGERCESVGYYEIREIGERVAYR